MNGAIVARQNRTMQNFISFTALKWIIGSSIFFAGWYTMLWLGSRFMGDFASSMVAYFLGATFIILPIHFVFWQAKNREKIALKLAIAAILLASVWLTFEEKIIMPLVANQCAETCQQVEYRRYVPFDNFVMVYTPKRGWQAK